MVRQSTTESANCVRSKHHARSSATIQTDGTPLLSLLPLCRAGSPNAPMNMYGCPKQYNFGAIQHNPKAKELPPMLGRPLAFAWAGRTAHLIFLRRSSWTARANRAQRASATRQPCRAHEARFMHEAAQHAHILLTTLLSLPSAPLAVYLEHGIGALRYDNEALVRQPDLQGRRQ